MHQIIDNRVFFSHVEALLDEGQEVRIPMRGESMRPLLRDRLDQVVLRRFEADEEPASGDVVLFRYEGRHLLHRIVHAEQGVYTLQGDGNYKCRESCAREDIRALMKAVIRPGGKVIACRSRRWRCYSRLWTGTHPLLRRYCLAALRRLRNLGKRSG